MSAGYMFPPVQIPTELDYLFDDLVHPKNTSHDKQLSYLVHYYPKLKNKNNIKILTLQFLKSPLFYHSIDGCFTLENSVKIIECFQYIVFEKYKISNPTLKFHDFYAAIYESLCDSMKMDPTSYWKILAVSAGCIASKSSRERYNLYPEYSNIIIQLDHLFVKLFTDSFIFINGLNFSKSIKQACISHLLYINDQIPPSFYQELYQVDHLILAEITELLYFSSAGLNKGELLTSPDSYKSLLKNFPLLRQINRFAFLYSQILENSVQTAPLLHSISASLDYVVAFTTTVSNGSLPELNKTDKWELLKYIFFTNTLLFESISKKLVSGDFMIDYHALVISNQILRSNFNFSYILDKIGTGGFDSYNFVYDSLTNLMIDFDLNNNIEGFLYSILNEIPNNLMHLYDDQASKLNYFLKLSESFSPILRDSFKTTSLLPLLNGVIINESLPNSCLELAHSVMVKLIAFSSSPIASADNDNSDIVYPYLMKVFSQFPLKLSLSQTTIIFESCLKSTWNRYVPLMDLVKSKIKLATFARLPPRKTIINDNEAVIFEDYDTIKAGLLSIYIRSILYCNNVDYLIGLLDDIKHNMDSIVGDHDIYKLYDHLWNTLINLNSLNSRLGQISLDWWDETINNNHLGPRL